MHTETAGSDILYHITELQTAVKITRTGHLVLTLELNSTENYGRHYYFSMARSMQSSYIREGLWAHSVIFEFDGRKLGQRYKIAPIDYWYSEGETAPTRLRRRSSKFEMEDRLVSEKPTIPVNGYVRAIHFAYSEKPDIRLSQFELYKWCLKNAVPVFVYASLADLKILNKSHTLKFKPVTLKTDPSKRTEEDKRLRHLLFKSDFRVNSLLAYWVLYVTPSYQSPEKNLALVNKLDREKPEGGIKRLYIQLQNPEYHRLGVKLKSVLRDHSSTAIDSINQGRLTLHKLVEVMRKHKWSPDNLIHFMKEKWHGDST